MTKNYFYCAFVKSSLFEMLKEIGIQ